MSIHRQCDLLGVPRSSYYHKPKRKISLLDELLMQAIDRIYMAEPTYGSRSIRNELKKLGYGVGRKRVQRLMRVMDWSSRYVISWRLSNSLDESFCVACLEDALEAEGTPEIFNTDRGASSLEKPSRACSMLIKLKSVWMAGDEPWTTS